MLTDDETVSAA